MSRDLLQTNDFTDSPDQVIQETPVAGHGFAQARISDATSNSEGDEPGASRLPQPYTPPSERLHGKPSNECLPRADVIEGVIQRQTDNATPFNRRTPNLDRIAKFFKDNRSPRREGLLQKFEASELEDTPVSERREGFQAGRPMEVNPSYNNIAPPSDHKERPAASNRYLADVNGSPKNRNERLKNSIKQQGSRELDLNARETVRLRSVEQMKLETKLQDNDLQEKKNILSRTQELTSKGQTKSNSISRDRSFTHSSDSDRKNTQSAININTTDNETSDNRSSESSPLLALGKGLPGRIGGIQAIEENTLDDSRIDDTTEGNYSEMWVLRPNKNGIFNSNKSTQVINTTESQGDIKRIGTQNCRREDIVSAEEMDQTQTQVISSYATRNSLSQQKIEFKSQNAVPEICSSTQIIQSPEHAFSNSLETPKGFPKINFEPILEVPETSSPSKIKNREVNGNSSPSPAEKERTKYGSTTQADHIQETVHLQISGKPESNSSQEEEFGLEIAENRNDAIVVLSEPDFTQELPEIEEETSRGNAERPTRYLEELDEDQFISRKRKRHIQTIELVTEEENRSRTPTPKKELRRQVELVKSDFNQNDDQPAEENLPDERNQDAERPALQNFTEELPVIELPRNVRERDDEYLSKEDIKFEDSVWCQYSLDYNYYPGRILSLNEQSDNCWVYFDTGKSLTNCDDIHYLDIRVGDTVNLAGKKHEVVALECRSSDMEAIRCIRGYDTVRLRRKKKSGLLGQKVFIKPLAMINLDVSEWTKRPKVILEDGSHTKAKAFQGLQRPIRGRKNAAPTLSPRKVNQESRAERAIRPKYKEDSEDDEMAEVKKDDAESRASMTALDLSQVLGQRERHGNTKIFQNCVFVLTGLSEDRQNLADVIKSEGGEILDVGFSELFAFENLKGGKINEDKYTLQLVLQEQAAKKRYRFACLVTTRHLRSLKYLETLALGWPTLHWKFIRECLQKGRLCIGSLYRYLLPSGESYRLAFDAVTKTGVIKSNNIFQFYLKLTQNLPLDVQVDAMKDELRDYQVLLYGQSELDHFIKFSLACLGVSNLYHLKGKTTSSSLEELHLLTERLDKLLEGKPSLKVVIYVNKNNSISSDLLENVREEMNIRYRNESTERLRIHVESKEWLIQTIINGGAGFEG